MSAQLRAFFLVVDLLAWLYFACNLILDTGLPWYYHLIFVFYSLYVAFQSMLVWQNRKDGAR